MSTLLAAEAVPSRSAGSPWSVPDAALFWGISARTAWRLIDSGKVKSIRIAGRVLIPDSEVQRVAKEGCH